VTGAQFNDVLLPVFDRVVEAPAQRSFSVRESGANLERFDQKNPAITPVVTIL